MKGVCERQLSEFARSSIHERASAEDRRDGRDGRTGVDGAKVSGTMELLSPLSPLNLALFASCISATMTGRMRRNRRVSCANSVLSPLLCSGGYGATRVIITPGKLLPNSLFILDAVQCLPSLGYSRLGKYQNEGGGTTRRGRSEWWD